MNISALKKQSSMDKLSKALEGLSNNQQGGKDTRFWEPEVDKAGNGYAVLRFLHSPAVDGPEGTHWVRYFEHFFQGPGGWLVENCPTTHNKKCPICEVNTRLWNESDNDKSPQRAQARNQKRKLNYVANVLVIKDPARPENEGKVFLYKFGAKIFDKLAERFPKQLPDGSYEKHDSVDPDFLKFDPFDFWKGANFKLKIRKVEGYRNYDKSEFEAPSALSDDDSEIEKVWKSEHSLKEIVDGGKFKTYDELKAKFDRVLGVAGSKNYSKSAESVEVEEEDVMADATASGDDDTLSYFNKLANE